jgi:4-hydroxymandelate oxidase
MSRLPLSRRAFVGALAALPFGRGALAQEPPLPPSVLYRREPAPITAADQVLNVMDFEPLARTALPPAHYAYIATGIDDDLTVVRNHAAFDHYEIRARRFTDETRLDTSLKVFGEHWPSPLYLSAVGALDTADAQQHRFHSARRGCRCWRHPAVAAALSDQ